jgi:hypothetical protein
VILTVFALIITTVMKVAVGISYYLAWKYTRSTTVKGLAIYFVSTALNTLLLIKLVIDNKPNYPPTDILYLMLLTGVVFVATYNIFNTIWIKKDPSHITNRIDPKDAAKKINETS